MRYFFIVALSLLPTLAFASDCPGGDAAPCGYDLTLAHDPVPCAMLTGMSACEISPLVIAGGHPTMGTTGHPGHAAK